MTSPKRKTKAGLKPPVPEISERGKRVHRGRLFKVHAHYPDYLRAISRLTTRLRETRQNMTRFQPGTAQYQSQHLRLQQLMTYHGRLSTWKTRFIREGVMGQFPVADV